jgi:hypothetical protein
MGLIRILKFIIISSGGFCSYTYVVTNVVSCISSCITVIYIICCIFVRRVANICNVMVHILINV